MNIRSVDINPRLGDDVKWAQVLEHGGEDLQPLRATLTALLSSLDYQSALRKADFLEATSSLDWKSAEYREIDAAYARWKASAATIRRLAQQRRDAVDDRIREIFGDANSIRTAVYKLASHIAAYEADETMDEGALFDLLDDVEIFARSRQWTLREWLTEGKGKW